jgi:hypothetical protein
MKPLILLSTIAGLACGASALGAPAQEVNACAFLKEEEISSALHLKVTPGQRDDSGEETSGEEAGAYTSTCMWRVEAAGAPSYVILNLMQWPAGSGGGKRFLQNFRDAAKSGEIGQEPVPLKIAEEGLWWGDGVAASKGDRGFGISVHLAGGRDKERGVEEALAKKIAARL